jgi:hypothetical protein
VRRGLVARERPTAPRFAAVQAPLPPALAEGAEVVELSDDARRALDVAPGDELAVLPLE